MQSVGSKCRVFNQKKKKKKSALNLRDFLELACLKHVHYCIRESILVWVNWLSSEYFNLVPQLIFSDKPAMYI